MSHDDSDLEVDAPVVFPPLVLGPPVVVSDLMLKPPVDLDGTVQVGTAVRLPVLTFSADGQRTWVGQGEPDVVPGASPGDLYLDEDTGTLYRLS